MKKAFNDAMNRANAERSMAIYEDVYPTVLEVFVRNLGEEKAREYMENVLNKYGEETVLLTYSFFTAGYVIGGI